METRNDPNGKKFNAGYEIIQHIDLGDRQFVVGHRPTAPSPYVSWEYIADRDSYYQGHYFEKETDATLDMFRRASNGLSFDGKSLGTALLSDEDRQALFLEFSEQNAKEDIAAALAEELDYQDISYDQNALLADPDFMSRAMFQYNRLDHSYENEALRDEIATILQDYPQYIVPAQEYTLNLFPEQRALIFDLLTLPTAQIPEKYGPLGDNISFAFEISNSHTATLEIIPCINDEDQYYPFKNNPHYAELTIFDPHGNVVNYDSYRPQALSQAIQDKELCIEFTKVNMILTLEESESLRKTGNSFIFQSTSEDERYSEHNGEICKIQRPLSTSECDILCTGFMWEAEFPNGDVLHVFDDELTALTPEKSLKPSLSQQIQDAQNKSTITTQEHNMPEYDR